MPARDYYLKDKDSICANVNSAPHIRTPRCAGLAHGTAVAVCSEFACVRWVLGRVAGSSFKGALQTLSASILWTAPFLLSRVCSWGGGVVVENSRSSRMLESNSCPSLPASRLTCNRL